MKRMGIFSTAMLFIGLLSLIAYPASSPSISGAARLAGELMKNHSYLLNDSERSQVDKINRALRQFEDTLQRSENDSNNASIEHNAQETISKLQNILSKASFTIPIEIQDNKAVFNVDSPVAFPGDEGALLFKIDDGGDETFYDATTLDYAFFPENQYLNLDAKANATTWLLVTVIHAPQDGVNIPFQINRPGKPPVRDIIPIATPEFATLKVSVLSSETGEPVPSMMRMVWKTNGQDRPPSNAIEIAPQMDRQGSPSGRRNAQLPGKLAGPYWCVPKPFSMQVPPGEWEIVVRRGVEHLAVFDSFTAKPGETVEKIYRPRRWVDMREHGWYSGDEHVHCQMLSDDDAGRLMAWVKAEDIHLANVVKMGDIYRTWFEQRGWGKDYRVESGDVVLSPGQECPRTHRELGHTSHMNTQSMVRNTDKYFQYDWVFQKVHEQGGLSGFCHVLFGMFQVHRGMTLYLPNSPVDYIEIMQFNQLGTELYYDFLNLGFKITAGAGSDVPWGGTVGEVRMYAYLGDVPFSPDAWFDSVRRGRTFVTNGPMIEFTVDGAMPGDELLVKENQTVHVNARVWGHPDRFVPKKLDIVKHGEVVGTIDNENNKDSLSIDLDIDAGQGCWIAARAEGSDGSNAHTTPVYAINRPHRFWDKSKAGKLIGDRMASLQEVEDMLKDYAAQVESGQPNLDLAVIMLNEQSDALRERIENARKYYRELKEKLK